MSDTPDDERDPRPGNAGPVNAGPGAEGRGVKGRDARTRSPGRPASRAEPAERSPARQRIGIRELRQHASVYVDLAEKGYTVDITNRGRLVAQLVPAFEPGSPLERLIAAGVIEPAEEPGGVGDIEPYPPPASGRPSTDAALRQARALTRLEQPAAGQAHAGQAAAGRAHAGRAHAGQAHAGQAHAGESR